MHGLNKRTGNNRCGYGDVCCIIAKVQEICGYVVKEHRGCLMAWTFGGGIWVGGSVFTGGFYSGVFLGHYFFLWWGVVFNVFFCFFGVVRRFSVVTFWAFCRLMGGPECV